MGVTNRLVFDPTDANTIAASSSLGAYLRAEDGTLLTHTTNGGREELDVNDSSAAAILTTIDAVLDNIYIDTQAMVVDLAALEVELLDQGTVLDNIYVDTQAMVVDLAAIEVLLTSIDSDTGNILSDTNALVVDLAAIEVLQTSIDAELSAQGTTLDSIETSVQIIDNLVLAEDDAASGGEPGVQLLAVRQDTLANSVSADGDFASLKVDSSGSLYVTMDKLNIDVNDVANVAIENTATPVSASAVAMVASALAGRSYCFLANEGNKSVYFGKDTGLTAANGFPIHPGEKLEVRVGPAVSPKLIGEATASSEDIRVMELS